MIRTSPNLMIDFKGVFYNTRCLFQHADPYKTGAPLRAYLADEVGRPMPPDGPRQVLMIDLYLPTASIFIAPFAMLPWETAQVLWTIPRHRKLYLCRVPDVGFRSKLRAGNLLWLDLLCSANTEAFFPFGNPWGSL